MQYIYIHNINVHTYEYTYTVYMCIYIYVHVCMRECIRIHACMHPSIHPSTHIYIFTYIHYRYAYKPYIFTLHIVVYRHTTQSLRSFALPLSFQIPVSIMSDIYGLSNSTASIAQEVMITKQNRKDQQRVLCCGFLPLGR